MRTTLLSTYLGQALCKTFHAFVVLFWDESSFISKVIEAESPALCLLQLYDCGWALPIIWGLNLKTRRLGFGEFSPLLYATPLPPVEKPTIGRELWAGESGVWIITKVGHLDTGGTGVLRAWREVKSWFIHRPWKVWRMWPPWELMCMLSSR